MMSRNPTDNNAASNTPQQQPTEGYNQQFGGDNRGIANRGNVGNYSTTTGGFPEHGNTARRYTLSGGVNDGNLTQQGPVHGNTGGDLMGNNSQRSHHSQQQIQGGNIGYRGDLRSADSPSNLNSMNHGYPYGAELSPTHLAHRMSLGYYPMSGGSAVSPSYGTLGDAMDLSGRGLASAVPPTVGGATTQDEREEELLLQLLLARRQRGRVGDGKGRPQSSLSDEIMQRFRQNRNMPGQRRSSSIPQLPGIPPLYTESMPNSGGMVHPNMYPTMDNYGRTGGNSDSFASQFQMRQIHDTTERIDRNPGHFQMSDARMSEMREFSERSAGIKRGMGSMGMGAMMVPGGGMVGMGYPPAMKSAEFPYGGDMREANQPAFKKKRTHKKKPSDMPRRPLSAYNLFFSEERERILKEIAKKEGKSDASESEEGEREVTAEEVDHEKDALGVDDEEKPKALLRPLIPAEKKRRPHRKTHGKISFQELARMVGERWKSLPDDERKYYQDLAQQDMKRQKVAMEQYYAKQNAGAYTPGDTVKPDPGEISVPIDAAVTEEQSAV